MSSQNCAWSGSDGTMPKAGRIQTTSHATPRFAIQADRYPQALKRHHTTWRMLGSQIPAIMSQRAKISHWVISCIIIP